MKPEIRDAVLSMLCTFLFGGGIGLALVVLIYPVSAGMRMNWIVEAVLFFWTLSFLSGGSFCLTLHDRLTQKKEDR